MDNLVSIIVPVYNGEGYLKECLDSLVSQSYINIEIIIIDDGSTDLSYEICKEYSEQDARVVLIKQKNQGVSTARNKGIDLEHGHYIMFCDSDDIFHSDYVKHMVCSIIIVYNSTLHSNFAYMVFAVLTWQALVDEKKEENSCDSKIY